MTDEDSAWSDDGLPPDLRPMTVAELVVDGEVDHDVAAQLLGGQLRTADAVHHAGMYAVPYSDVPRVAAVYADQERVATVNLATIVTATRLVRALEAAAEEGAAFQTDADDVEDDVDEADERAAGAWYQ